MAAGLWPRQQAVAAGARRDLVAVAYRPTTGALVRTTWALVTMDAYHAANALRQRAAASDRRDRRRLEQNTMRGGTRAFVAVPWTQDLFMDNTEFDVAWRVIFFGGMTSVMTERIDHPEHGFRWRGERMEWSARGSALQLRPARVRDHTGEATAGTSSARRRGT